jgi:drug/metabolite transporter (DMT)-like permease
LRGTDVARLLALATLWSMQYIFLRVAVPALGTGLVAEMRALAGALFLVPAALVLGQHIAPLRNWRSYFAVCLTNNVFPFVCFAFGASVLPAGYLAIINGTVPLWTALFAAGLLGERLGARRLAGFATGIAGVALIVNLGPVALDARTVLAALVSLAGAASWGWGGVMIKQHTGKVPAIALAAGTMSFAALLMSPLWAGAPAAHWTLGAAAAALALGALCSGVAYLAFFTLVRDIGPSRTLSVTFLIPVLGVLWGWLLLDEAVTLPMLGGAALVFAALALVLRH